MASTSFEALALAELILNEFKNLGLDANLEKSVVNLTQRTEQLGMIVDTIKGVFEVHVRRWDNLQGFHQKLALCQEETCSSETASLLCWENHLDKDCIGSGGPIIHQVLVPSGGISSFMVFLCFGSSIGH